MREKSDPEASPEAGNNTGLEQLRQKAQRQGYLLLEDLLAARPDLEANMAHLEELFIDLVNQGLKMYTDLKEAEAEIKPTVALEEESGGQADRGFVDISAVAADDLLRLYLTEMDRRPLLTLAQEITLAQQIEQGRQAASELRQIGSESEAVQLLEERLSAGNEAREHLIKANTRLVVSIARKYQGHGVPLVDLIQEGNLGLMTAISKFDYRRGNKFSTYATWWIRQAVTRALANQGRTIRLPVHIHDGFRKLQQISQQLEQAWGRSPTPEELAVEMELAPSQVRGMLQASQQPVSLELPIGAEGEAELADLIEDEDAPHPPDTADRHFLREALEEALLTLPAREAKILKLRFGLQDGRSHTLGEIGQKFGLTRERIRQLERRALRQLRHPCRFRPLKEYWSETLV